MRKLLILAVSVALVSCSANYSKGSRVGVVRKFSHKGLLVKSWEGELLLGGVISTGGKNPELVNETWDFAVDPEARHGEDAEEIVRALDQAQDSGKRVKLYYNQDTTMKLRTDSDYLVYKVQVLD